MKGKVTISLADFKLLEANKVKLTRIQETARGCFVTECRNAACEKRKNEKCHIWSMYLRDADECVESQLVTVLNADKLVEEIASFMGYGEGEYETRQSADGKEKETGKRASRSANR